MDLTSCEVVTNNIQSLPDTPAMEADELKKKFDQTGIDLKDYINNILIKEIKAGVEKSEEDTVKKILKTYKNDVTTIADIEEDEDYTVPTTYKVNTSNLDVYFEGCILSLNEHYTERGTGDSDKIRFKFKVPKNSKLSFVVRK